jgi:hypothetical protein
MKAPEFYEIRVEEHLCAALGTWFEGLNVRQEANGETVLCGWLDQAALHGVLMKIRDLGLKLIALQRVERIDLEG